MKWCGYPARFKRLVSLLTVVCLQGDFIQYLMDLLGPELSKRGSQVYRHTLTNVLETALNASNAKFEVRTHKLPVHCGLTVLRPVSSFVLSSQRISWGA